jgi:membrane-bound metal-dependent hydrolase YbcI (DUF457 family)
MMFATHLAVSLTAILILPQMQNYLAAFMLGALLPDIDSTKSLLGSRLKIFGWLFEHRGLFHSITMLLVLALPLYLVVPQAGLAFAAGYLIHLALDALTREGIMPFYPVGLRVRGFIRTGSIAEYIIFGLSIMTGFLLLE